MSKVYPSDLTTAQFAFLSTRFCPETAETSPRGRPRTTSLWAILNAIFYVLCEGCSWRGLPGDFPPWQTVYTYFRRWKQDGTLLAIHDELYTLSRLVEGRSDSPSELIVDSQSVKTATMIAEAVGYDGAKKQTTLDHRYAGTHLAGLGYGGRCARTRRRQAGTETDEADGANCAPGSYRLGRWGV